MSIFGELEGMMGAAQGGFQITQYHVVPFEMVPLHTLAFPGKAFCG
jgi:hypothetical protein